MATEGKKRKATTKGSEEKEALFSPTSSVITDLRNGTTLSAEYFRKNAWLILLIVVVVLSLMGLRYKTKTKMEEIKSLQSELQRSQSTMLKEKAEYMSLIRESEMEKLVAEKQLGLIFQEQPPYRLPDEEK